MTFVFGGYEVSPATARIMLDADLAAQRQQEREEAEREARRWQAMTTAPIIRAQYEAAAAEAEFEARRQERIAERERQERIAAAEDYRQMLLASGLSRWRTIGEVLEASRGAAPAPMVTVAQPAPVAQRSGGVAHDESDRLLARSAELSRALTDDPVLVRARHGRYGTGVAHYPSGEITRTCDAAATVY